MSEYSTDTSKIFSIDSDNKFNEIALDLFRWQAKNVAVYSDYLKHIKVDVDSITKIEEIPFLPIQFFKSHQIIAKDKSVAKVFKSSGTTSTGRSEHYVSDLNLYEKSFEKAFDLFYGKPEDNCIIALLPSYLDQGDSSLIYMVDALIKKSNSPESQFLLESGDKLLELLNSLQEKGTQTILWGVTYALLDFIEEYTINFPELIVMETGGMKGRRKEMTKTELHGVLSKGFGVSKIHSEYGMTELLSQAYSLGDGIFKTPPWMEILTREISDPFSLSANGKTGGINVIDLANINSCAFIATQDLGKVYADNTFEILGRFDHSDTRGCNLLVQ